MTGTDITYTTRGDEDFTGYLASPTKDVQVPGILMITAIFGIDDEMKELANAWAADGFLVSVPCLLYTSPSPRDRG